MDAGPIPPGGKAIPKAALLLLGLAAGVLPIRALEYPLLLDDTQIFDNADLRDLSRLPGLLGRGYWEGSPGEARGDLYRPVAMATFNLNFALAGDARPGAYRAVNFVLHGLAAALLAALAARVTGSNAAGLLSGSLHALLPVHADTVVGIIHRSELLAAVFAVAAALLHARARDRGRASWGAAGLYTLAVLSKESAAALPLALLLLDRLGQAEKSSFAFRGALRLYGPHALALSLCLAARFAVLGRIGLEPGGRYFEGEGFGVVLLTMASFSALHYARPLVLGLPLIADFSSGSFPPASAGDPFAWVCLLGWIALGAVSLALAWRRRLFATGLAWTLCLALPVSNVVLRTGVLGAHRLLYLPATGWCLALGALLGGPWSARGRARTAMRAGILALLGFYASVALARGGIWRDGETFYRETLRHVPENKIFLYNLGETLTEKGRFAEAEPIYRRVLALDPEYFRAGNNLVGVLLEQGKSEEALALVEDLSPTTDWERADRHNARAVVLGRRGGPGDYESALSESRKASALVPEEAAFRVTAAQALLKLGRREEAERELRQALALPAPTRSALALRERTLAMLRRLPRPNPIVPPRPPRPSRP